MVLLGMVLRYIQESRADKAAEKLKRWSARPPRVMPAMKRLEIPLKELVPGDIVFFQRATWFPVMCDCYRRRIYSLTRLAHRRVPAGREITGGYFRRDIKSARDAEPRFLGTNVESGTGQAVVVQTGSGPTLVRWPVASLVNAK